MKNTFDLIVVGGGIIGLATAYKYQLQNPSNNVLVIEKEKEIALHQTGRNSGVIHSGIYYKPGSLKATLCNKGYSQLIDFAKKNNVAFDLCGKLIVATKESELPGLKNIYERGIENGLEGLRIIGPEEIKSIEPFVEGISAIHVPQTGIIDYVGFCDKLEKSILTINPFSAVIRNTKAISFLSNGESKIVMCGTDQFISKGKIITCGGLEADRLAKADGLEIPIKIVPFRGDYYDLTEKGKHKVKHLIYPVPNPEFPFLGVHFTRMIKGGVECGPNAVFSFKREGYSKTAFSIKDTLSALGFKGTWKLFRTHWKYGIGEYERAFSKSKFLQALRALIPSLQAEDITPARAGVRAQALGNDGKLIDDFYIVNGKIATHVINAPSPAATASLAIADYILENYIN